MFPQDIIMLMVSPKPYSPNKNSHENQVLVTAAAVGLAAFGLRVVAVKLQNALPLSRAVDSGEVSQETMGFQLWVPRDRHEKT